ncbi:MAG: RidA family protein [Propionibacteriales bacterium]|nr:RidA family protein [Propionibacteriales bacterium]
MSTPEERLAGLGLSVPDVVPPVAAYLPAVRSGAMVYTAGQIPMREGSLVATGKVGADVTQETAYECARQCALNAMAAIRSVTGTLEGVRILKVGVFVASAPDFTAQAAVANGASELFGEVFGELGVHARSAVGVAVLPLDSAVEVEVIAEVVG